MIARSLSSKTEVETTESLWPCRGSQLKTAPSTSGVTLVPPSIANRSHPSVTGMLLQAASSAGSPVWDDVIGSEDMEEVALPQPVGTGVLRRVRPCSGTAKANAHGATSQPPVHFRARPVATQVSSG